MTRDQSINSYFTLNSEIAVQGLKGGNNEVEISIARVTVDVWYEGKEGNREQCSTRKTWRTTKR